MFNRRDINLLRSDVSANCKIFLQLCRDAGLKVIVTSTVRDIEYQTKYFNEGFTNTKIPSFHSKAAGLAFDICQNIKGKEYNDDHFWDRVSSIGKQMGFEWGGDWKSIIDKPHFQWSDGGKYTGSMIRNKIYPPEMPLYTYLNFSEDEEILTQDKFNEMLIDAIEYLGTLEPSEWSQNAREWAESNSFISGDENGNKKYKKPATREELIQMLYNILGEK